MKTGIILASIISIGLYYYNYKKKQQLCLDTSDYKIVAECARNPYMSYKENLAYLRTKDKVLIDLMHSDNYKDIVTRNIIDIYAEDLLISTYTEDDYNFFISLLKTHLQNEYFLDRYINFNKTLSTQDKVKLIKEYLDKNGPSNKDDICSPNSIYINA